MSDTPSAMPQQAKLEGRMFMFEKPELLSKEQHAGLGLTRPEKPYEFCSKIRAVPITVAEITMAQKHYPIIFTDEKNPLPMAVLGLIDDVNLFVDEDGNWEENTYIPAYIRRYPFALAGDQESNRMALILDAGYKGVQKDANVPFFDGDELSPATKQAMEFCSNYERDRQITISFAQQLAKMEIVSAQMAQFTPDGEGQESKPFAQYHGVEEKRLNELSDEQYLSLRKSNILPIVYAQLISMGNWRLLMDRRARRFNLTRESLLEQVEKANA